MSRRRHAWEQIKRKLREAEVELLKGQTTGDVGRKLGITEQTYYRRCEECNAFRPHSALGYRTPAPEAVMWPQPTLPRPASAVGLTKDAH